jgi:pSer/pThr/pTyr-binding forkhead associated (FHA) protein
VDEPPPLHWILVHPPSGRELTLPDQTEITLGRNDPTTGVSPDIDLSGLEAGHTISRRHARLRRRDHRLLVMEEASVANGTFHNGVRLAAGREAEVQDGDELRLGMVTVLVRSV